MLLTNHKSIQEVIFFPQMRPEKNEVKLNEEEKKVFEFMKKNKKVEIKELKDFAELSNKKWDKTIKSLTKNKLLKVHKNDTGIFVKLK